MDTIIIFTLKLLSLTTIISAFPVMVTLAYFTVKQVLKESKIDSDTED